MNSWVARVCACSLCPYRNQSPLVAAGPHQVLTPDETARPSGHRRVAALRELHKLGRVSENLAGISLDPFHHRRGVESGYFSIPII